MPKSFSVIIDKVLKISPSWGGRSGFYICKNLPNPNTKVSGFILDVEGFLPLVPDFECAEWKAVPIPFRVCRTKETWFLNRTSLHHDWFNIISMNALNEVKDMIVGTWWPIKVENSKKIIKEIGRRI